MYKKDYIIPGSEILAVQSESLLETVTPDYNMGPSFDGMNKTEDTW